jgi:hypothetical protein
MAGQGRVGETPFTVVYSQRAGEDVRGRALLQYSDGEIEVQLSEPFPNL